MAYAKSNKIKVFPTSNRGTIEITQQDGSKIQAAVDPGARLNTEGNLTGILKHITDEKSFILNVTKTDNEITSIEFIIDGYYFNLTDADILNSKPLYASIEYESEEESKTESGDVFQRLKGTDVISDGYSKYQGVNFTGSSGGLSTYLQLLDTEGEPPFDNYIKFRTNYNFRSVYIDDGDLDT